MLRRTTLLMYTVLSFVLSGPLLALTSCSQPQLQAAAELTLNAKLADLQVQSGQPVDVVITAELSETEINTVIAATDTYQLFRDKWQITLDSPGSLVTNIAMLRADYANLYLSYGRVRAVVLSHWAEYTPEQQVRLTEYQGQAVAINDNVQTLLADNRRSEAVTSALRLGLMVAQVAL